MSSDRVVFAGLVRTSDPAAEPLSLTEAKAHLRVDFSDDDTLITALIKSARQAVEQATSRSLITQTWQLTLDTFPSTGAIRLPMGPVQSVTSVNSYDEDDTETLFAATNYLVDTAGDRLALNLDAVWPSDLRPYNAGVITYVTGYGNASTDVPDDLILATRMLVGHYYENREAVGASMSTLPLGAQALLQPYVRMRL